ncbi:hypothetical protein, partial [Bacillus sp. JCM 19034]|uniref:hypothetical protein n=1 Tax=Bacillus sp. JCM 19034 TaxID=1481928 RepID=UPI000A48A67D
MNRLTGLLLQLLQKMTIRQKLLSIFLLILMLFCMTFFLQFFQVTEVEERIKVMADSTEEALLLASINSLMKEKYILVNEYVERGGFVEPALEQAETE